MRRTGARVEGRKPLSETRAQVVELARQLARARPKGGMRSLRKIATELTKAGYTTATGAPFAAMQVKRMLEQRPSAAN